MTSYAAAPPDSRYIPFTQQAACCVPTCIQMVMYKNGIPLVPAEEIGYYLGLVVNPAGSYLFYKVRTATEPPSAGYGTQIYNPEYEPNVAFRKLGIPLSLKITSINALQSSTDLLELLKNVEENNFDALLCFNHGVLVDDPDKNWGHVCVFDRIVDGKIRIIDPSPEHPKWRSVEVDKMFNAMQRHGEKNSAGVWKISGV